MVLSKFYGETPGAWGNNTYSANAGILQLAGLVRVEYVQEQRQWIIKHIVKRLCYHPGVTLTRVVTLFRACHCCCTLSGVIFCWAHSEAFLQ